jgi:hypothetical protein
MYKVLRDCGGSHSVVCSNLGSRKKEELNWGVGRRRQGKSIPGERGCTSKVVGFGSFCCKV